MFHEYSFQSSARQGTSSYNHTGNSPSPYSYSSNHQPVSSTDLSMLTHHFGQQSIRYDQRSANSNYTTTSQHQSSSTSATYSVQPPRDSYECPHMLSSVRSQRQANTRLQCQPSHARDISTLVERMIASGEQCLICSPAQDEEPPTQEEDEGIYMGESDYQQAVAAQTLNYRRSSDFSSAQSYVTKSIRVRKSKRPRSDPSRSK
jgi:hypothetical protein